MYSTLFSSHVQILRCIPVIVALKSQPSRRLGAPPTAMQSTREIIQGRIDETTELRVRQFRRGKCGAPKFYQTDTRNEPFPGDSPGDSSCKLNILKDLI